MAKTQPGEAAPPEPAAGRVGVLGAGNVGGALASLLLPPAPRPPAERPGVGVEVAGGAVAAPARPRPGIPAALVTGDAKALAADPSVDVVVELIGGRDPAHELGQQALAAR